ncbi:MAG: gcn5-related N-acetyltransferase [Bacteroidetes bacterium]|nr:MAG: gcn5-related N-acetyltransferase [Bacteroidota bacterium]
MLEISVPYNLAFAQLVASFMEEAGACYGADEREKNHLRLAGEEAFAFIMAGIPASGLKDQFKLRCQDDPDGLLFQFSNHGRPLNVRHIPDFSIDDPDNTADGLSLHLLKRLSEKLLFRNLGQNGWELVLLMRFHSFRPLSGLSVAGFSKQTLTASNAELSVRKATAADVPGIINLVYNTYRYSYVKTLFYDTEELAEAISSGKVLSLIALTGNGTVIGHNAVLVESQLLGEVGMSMVDPEYRKTGIFVSLLSATMEALLQNHPKLLLYARAVTSHKHSQAFLSGFVCCLLQLSVHPHASFVGMKGDQNERESLVFGVIPVEGELQKQRFFVPAVHCSMVRQLFSGGIIQAEIEAHTGTLMLENTDAITEWSLEKQHGSISVRQPGRDFDRFLRHETMMLQQEGVLTIDVSIAATFNQPAETNALLMKNSYFFSGLKPETDGSWKLIYTNLTHQKFNFDNLQLFSPEVAELRDYIKKLYLEIVN